MSTSEHQSPLQEDSVSLPNTLVSPQGKLVYLALAVVDTATTTDLQQMLGLSKLTLLPILASLSAKDLIQRTEDGYATR